MNESDPNRGDGRRSPTWVDASVHLRMILVAQGVVSGLRRLHDDERATTLTEFIIVLPIFVLVFVGIFHLGRLNEAAIRVGGAAYSEMWVSAKNAQLGDSGVHTSTRLAGHAVRTNMTAYRGLQQTAPGRQIVAQETDDMGRGLRNRGTLGESTERVERAHAHVDLGAVNGDVTSNIVDIVGESDYAKQLFDDGAGAHMYYPSTYETELGDYASTLGGPSLRPVAAAGIRYGSVVGDAHKEVDIPGKTIDFNQYFTTLVAPTWRTEGQATAVVRTTMEGIPAYKNLVGIAKNQPLSKESIEVPSVGGNP